ncbi:MAG: DnaD domain protein [Lachnospiraceae bacterium]|jgi:DnaD/phage-associated family protein|nr:DnaD domain protein [Lachnospiraceae bacterium]
MSPLTIYQDGCDDATIVSNLFIDEYMKDANDAQLKVFLYLIRMMSAHKITSISDIADKFNYTEKDILRALKHWEKNRLLTVDYDDIKNPIGIHLHPIVPKTDDTTAITVSDTVSSKKDAVGLVSVPTVTPVPKPLYEKPSYTLDDLRAFKEAEETSQLLFVVEQYLGKTLSPSEIRTILFFSDSLHFSGDLIDYLIQYCVERGKKDFRYIEKVAIGWADEGITTPKQAARSARKYEKNVYDIMKALGKDSNPTKTEADYILRWSRELGFSPDIIFEACERTVMATDKHRFEYCNTILVNWSTHNVRHKSDIKRLDAEHARHKETEYRDHPSKSTNGASKFNQFKQNNYDFEALEQELLSN